MLSSSEGGGVESAGSCTGGLYAAASWPETPKTPHSSRRDLPTTVTRSASGIARAPPSPSRRICTPLSLVHSKENSGIIIAGQAFFHPNVGNKKRTTTAPGRPRWTLPNGRRRIVFRTLESDFSLSPAWGSSWGIGSPGSLRSPLCHQPPGGGVLSSSEGGGVESTGSCTGGTWLGIGLT